MEWAQLLSAKRYRATGSVRPRPGRSEFESDFDRIAFSSAFRRLGRKTQVHPLAANDHVHTRLTHSLEVARVGNALGKTLGERLIAERSKYAHKLPKEITPHDLGAIVQAACLAHDLGNPPFGHAGEDAIIHWFEQNRSKIPEHLDDTYTDDLKAVEGNAQGFRIITQLENHIFNGGMQLTYATLGTYQKYPWTSRSHLKKFGSYISEERILSEIFDELGIKKTGTLSWTRHPLAFLVEAADDICYGIIDIEDAVEIGILPFDTAADMLLNPFSKKHQKEIRNTFRPKSHRVNFARMRGLIFDVAISEVIKAFLKNYDAIMDGEVTKSLFDLLAPGTPCRTLIADAKKLGRENIYNDTKKVEIEIGCYATFDTLLTEFCEAALNQAEVLNSVNGEHRLQWKSERVLALLGDHAPSKLNAPEGGWTAYQCVRRVIDFISGMTDNYAVYIAKQLQGGGFSGGQRP